MKIVFYILIIIHALIHLFGFLKAFEWASFSALTQPISKPMGILWLVAFLLLTTSVITHFLGYQNWYLWGFAAVLLSQFLIISVWQDAKFGSILNLLLFIIALVAWGQHRFAKKVQVEKSAIIAKATGIMDGQAVDSLPDIIQKWLARSKALQHTVVNEVHLRQTLQMKMKPEQKEWIPAEAKQFFTIYPPAFHWTVHMQMNPVMPVVGRDQFSEGKGEMLIQLYGLFSMVNEQDNPKIDEGALQRYLAEIVWFPFAARAPYIEWESLSDTSARATLTYEGTSGSGEFTFDPSGKFKRFRTLRYKGGDAEAIRIPWTVEAMDHKVMQGVEMPTHCMASWELEEGTWTWLELFIEELEYKK